MGTLTSGLYTKCGWPNLGGKAFHLIRWSQIYLYVLLSSDTVVSSDSGVCWTLIARLCERKGTKSERLVQSFKTGRGLGKEVQEEVLEKGKRSEVGGLDCRKRRRGGVQCEIQSTRQHCRDHLPREEPMMDTIWAEAAPHPVGRCSAAFSLPCHRSKQGIRGTWRKGYHVPENATSFAARWYFQLCTPRPQQLPGPGDTYLLSFIAIPCLKWDFLSASSHYFIWKMYRCLTKIYWMLKGLLVVILAGIAGCYPAPQRTWCTMPFCWSCWKNCFMICYWNKWLVHPFMNFGQIRNKSESDCTNHLRIHVENQQKLCYT